MAEKFSLKDHLFNKEKVEHLAELIKSADTSFNEKAFIKDVLADFPNLELKARIVHIREMMHKHIAHNKHRSKASVLAYTEVLAILIASLPPELDPNKTDDDFGDFIYAPYSDYVAHYGCTKEYLTISLAALEEITKRFSCEDAIRYFIIAFKKETIQKMAQWSKSKNYHVRRLASEGSRPLLPWSARVHLESTEVIAKILDNLWLDSTRYVVRSVANHLNDISKQNAGLVIQTLKRWQAENKKQNKQSEKELKYLTRHSLRTLMKEGNSSAMKLLGYKIKHGASITNLKAKSKKIKMGEPLEFSFDIIANKEVRVLIDYTMYFASINGKQRSKVYRLKDLQLDAGKKVTLTKKHPLRANMSTIKLYPGVHKITLQINGVPSASLEFITDY